jgi:hypothetical protein
LAALTGQIGKYPQAGLSRIAHAGLDRAIAKGFILPDDRAEILAIAAINFDKGG